MDRSISCCFTGHRPGKLPWGVDERDARCQRIKQQLMQALERAYASGYRHFLCGMAQGGDTYFAEAVLELRERYPEVTLECARPCETQAHRWPAADQSRYQAILDQCNYETLVQHSYTRNCMIRRNRYMVDHASHIIAIYDGNPKGGTAQTLSYARRHKLTTDILMIE